MACASSGGIVPIAPRTTRTRAADAVPLLPVRAAVRLAQRPRHHVYVEARPEAVLALLEAVGPCLGVPEVGHRRFARRERDRPARERVADRGDLAPAALRGTRLRHDEGPGQVWSLGCDEQRRDPAQRLPDQDRRSVRLEREDGVGDVRGARHVGRSPLAPPVAAGVECEPMAPAGQPGGGLRPFPGVAGEAVEEERCGTFPPKSCTASRTPARSRICRSAIDHAVCGSRAGVVHSYLRKVRDGRLQRSPARPRFLLDAKV